MFEMVLDILFPLVLLTIPMIGAVGLARFVFGPDATFAFLTRVSAGVKRAALGFGQRVQRAAVAFVSDDVPDWQIEDVFIRLERLEEYLSDNAGRLSRLEEDASIAADMVADLQDSVSELSADNDAAIRSTPKVVVTEEDLDAVEADLPF
jgi:hypothetical protein